MLRCLAICVICSFLLFVQSARSEQPFVKTPLGDVQGYYKKSYGGRVYSAFEGIPFAKPPIGNLRFAEPEPAEKWDSQLIANTTHSCMCYMPIFGFKGVYGTEDCLYAYVYTPLERIEGNENLDVVVHIHGGGFMIGSPSFMSKPDYLMDRDVVYVTFNYRLAILGFLSTEDNEVPGNNGLKDQVLALKWIRDNIKYFGGNPKSVTLTGHSAGGASTHLHYFSPLSKGLFHRGLSLSGTALNYWSIIKNPLKVAKTISAHLDCPIDSNKNMVHCLRNVDAKNLVNAIQKLCLYFGMIPFIVFGPVIENGENAFITDYPYKLLKEGKIYDVPWITSNVKDEGIFPAGFFLMRHLLSEFDTKWNEIMPYMLDFHNTVDERDRASVVEAVRKYYYQDETVSDSNVHTMVELFSDRLFFVDSEMAVRLQANVTRSPVYYYFFSYVPVSHVLSFAGLEDGVCHGDDSGMIFRTVLTPASLDPKDEEIMKLLTEFVAVYAKTGIPSIKNIEWLPVEPGDKAINTLKIESSNDIEMIKMENIGSYEFWNSLPIKENDKLFPNLS